MPIVLNPQAGDSFALTGVTSAYNQPNAFAAVGQTVYSTASIPANANNALYGKALTFSNFSFAGNNGTFLVLSSNATSITVNNANGSSVHTSTGSAAFETQSFPVQYASKVSNLWSNQSGDSVTVNPSAGDCLVAVVIGLKQIVAFDQLHGTAPYSATVIGAPPTYGTEPGTADNFQLGQLAGLNDFNANPTISDFGGGAPVEVVASKLSGGTLTITYTNPNAAPSLGVTPSPYFTNGQVATLSNTAEPWLNGANITVATSTVTVEGTPTNPVYISQITATAGFTAPVFSLTSSDGVYEVPTDQPSNPELNGTTTYNGTITGGANDAFAGYQVTVASFGDGGNNGSFPVVASTATTLTVHNVNGVAEEGPQAFASNSISEGAGAAHYVATAGAIGTAFNSVTVTIVTTSGPSAPTAVGNVITANTGAATTVAAYVAAYPSVTTTAGVVNFTFTGIGTTLFTAGGPFTLSGGLNAATGTSTAYTQADDTGEIQVRGNVWTLAANSNIIDSDYTVSYPFTGPPANGMYAPSTAFVSATYPAPTPRSNLPTTFVPSSPYPSSKWSLDSYYPSVYVFVAPNVKGGSYKVNLNSMYQPGINVPADWAQGGEPIFDGGVNFQIYCLSGVATTSPVESSSIALTETILNPATAPGTLAVANADGDALISIALTKSANILAAGSTGANSPTSLALTAVSPLNYAGTSGQYPSQNYGGAVYTGTISLGANNGLVGNQFTVTGFVNTLNNSPAGTSFTCTASTATTLTLNNGSAIAATGASGHAAYTPLMQRIGSGRLVGSEAHYIVEYALVTSAGSPFNPGFNNPLGNAVLVASVAIKAV